MKNLKIEFKWALIFSVVVLAWMLLEKLSGLHAKYIDYHLYLTNLFAIPAIIMMLMALQEKKKLSYNGQINYTQGLISGSILSFLIAMISPITQWITTYIITPEYFPNVIKRSLETGYFNTIAEAEAHFNFQNYVILGVISSLFMGIVTTAIVMIFIRSKTKVIHS